jgi:hypothetical protein
MGRAETKEIFKRKERQGRGFISGPLADVVLESALELAFHLGVMEILIGHLDTPPIPSCFRITRS